MYIHTDIVYIRALLYLLDSGVSLGTRRSDDLGIELTLNTVEIDRELSWTVHLYISE